MVLVQVVTITESDTAKEQWLMSNVADFIDKGDVLVFANQKARVDIVSDKLKVAGYKYVPNPLPNNTIWLRSSCIISLHPYDDIPVACARIVMSAHCARCQHHHCQHCLCQHDHCCLVI